jgi:uncharacterized protein (TIGR02271 family)
MPDSSTQQVLDWRGRTLYDESGGKIGSIDEIYLDAQTEQPEWALVKTGMFGTKQSFVPIAHASESGDGVTVPLDAQLVKDAPKFDPDGELTQREESELYRHYGMEYSEAHSDSGLPEGGAPSTDRTSEDAPGTTGHDTSGPTTDDAMTRSEEELRVGKAERETGRVRLRKYVVEENVTQTVPVRREEVRLEREPVTEANIGRATDGPAISEEEHEVVLHQEEPVVEKRAVPKERVRLGKDVETHEEQVSDSVRKERIDVDGDADRS